MIFEAVRLELKQPLPLLMRSEKARFHSATTLTLLFM